MTKVSCKKVTFRVDASLDMGSGHVMRCLTLAAALKQKGVGIQFICRDLPGNMVLELSRQHYGVSVLPQPKSEHKQQYESNNYATWLAVPWQLDAEETMNALGDVCVDWLIVDHYGIDRQWHSKLRSMTKKIMVIDDLAERELDCNLLLDQTYKRKPDAYKDFVPKHCERLTGSCYALLRKEFSQSASAAIIKRKSYAGIQRIMIAMGGGDPENTTGKVLDGLAMSSLNGEVVVDVVLGFQAQSHEAIEKQARSHRMEINVLSNVTNMAELMLLSDLAIGAGGTTSWERCAMSLPSIIIVESENQSLIGTQLEKAGASITIEQKSNVAERVCDALEQVNTDRGKYQKMSNAARSICDGQGVDRVVRGLLH